MYILIVSENGPFGIGNQLASFCGFLSSKKPCNVVSFMLDEEQHLYLKRTAGVMYEKGLIKSSNIGALFKLVTLCVRETYPDIEKKLVKRQKEIG
jgi:hypothetical protein